MSPEERTKKLGYLIGCLEAEMPQYSSYEAPDDAQEAFDLYRALCNVRMPSGSSGHTLPEDFYRIQAEVLRDITTHKGVMAASGLKASRADSRLFLWQGDITTMKADAIVNAANSQMLGCFQPLHGCIDNIIHTMAGVELREKCYQLMKAQGHEEPTGTAKVTPGYNLPAAYVIHTVGPIVTGPLNSTHERLLASCYRSCLSAADENGIESIAFCCISTGVFMFPQKRAAEIAVSTCLDWLDSHRPGSVSRVVFNVFKDEDMRIYDALLNHKIWIE